MFIARDEFAAGSLSVLDLLTTDQSLVAIDAAVASSDAALIQDQIAVFKSSSTIGVGAAAKNTVAAGVNYLFRRFDALGGTESARCRVST